MKPQRIAILGITGAGKSTVSRKIAEQTGLPLFHMDKLFWRGKWEEVPEVEYLAEHAKILAENNQWIIEGWINPAMFHRLKQADLIIYLDYPGWLVAWRYTVRWFKHRKVARPELPEKSLERFKWRWFFLSFFRNERPEIEETLKLVEASKIVRLKSPDETRRFLATFPL